MPNFEKNNILLKCSYSRKYSEFNRVRVLKFGKVWKIWLPFKVHTSSRHVRTPSFQQPKALTERRMAYMNVHC